MKSLKQFINESVSNFRGWIESFTGNFTASKRLRFLNPQKDKDLINEFINTDKCTKTLYRASYTDHGSLWATKEGDICYEPVLSFSDSEKLVDNINKTHAYNDSLTSNNSDYIMKIILNAGSKSLDIAKYSKYPEQNEWIACGKFKVIKKYKIQDVTHDLDHQEIKFNVNVIEIEQVFDEDLFDIFEKLYSLSPQNKEEQYYINDKQEKADLSEEQLLNIIKRNIKKSISKSEKERWENKGIELTKDYLANVLAKRIYSNGIVYDVPQGYNKPTYEMILDIVKKHNIKMTGAKNCGFAELDFPEVLK